MMKMRRTIKRLALALLFCLPVALLMWGTGNAHAEDIPPCPDAHGDISQATYHSDIIDQTMRYSVYLPPCYDADSSYPVIYLMHGSNRTDEHWPSLGIDAVLDRGIVGGALPPVVVAMPYGGWIANENRFVGAATWSHIFLNEFMPTIEARYAVGDTREDRAIGGISRGGFWAFNIALRFPHLFGAVGGHSAFFDAGHFPAEYNPLHIGRNAAGMDAPRIWLDRGAGDYAFFGLDSMSDALNFAGIEHQYTIHAEGEHTDDYWAAHLRDYLAFYTATWERDEPLFTPPQIRHDFDVSAALDLYVPSAAFATTRMSIERERLLRVYAGLLDFDLILSESARDGLIAGGVALNTATATVPDAVLVDALWESPAAYTLIALNELTPRLRPLNIDGDFVLDTDLSAYPFAFAGDAVDLNRVTRMMFTGTTALARRTREAIQQNGVNWAASGIRDVVIRSDFLHISNEVSFAPRCPQSDEPVLGGLCAMDEHFALLYLLGVDIVELSGNHNNDYGFNAYLRTLAMYEDAGMMTVAGGRNLEAARAPLIIEHGGGSIALLSCNWNGPDFALVGDTQPGAAFCVLDWLREAIPALQAQHDTVIVTLQYAEYDRYTPIERQVNHFRQVADMGADVVLGTQAHQPQIYEFYTAEDGRDVFIHYGLGNFFFDQTSWEKVRFFMDEVILYGGQLLTVNIHTGIIEDSGRPRPMTAAESAEFLALMWREAGFLP